MSEEATNSEDSSTINVDSDTEIFNSDETVHDYNLRPNRTPNYHHLHLHQYLQQNSNTQDRDECYRACVKSIFAPEDRIGLNQMSVEKAIKVLGEKARIAVLKEAMQIGGLNVINIVDGESPLHWSVKKKALPALTFVKEKRKSLTPAKHGMLNVSNGCESLEPRRKELFHSIVAKLIWVMQSSQPDISLVFHFYVLG